MKKSPFYFLSFSIVLLSLIACEEKKYSDALSPSEALKSFQLHDDFNIEVFASEPFVLDPVEMIFDEQGIAWVVEMYDYPYKPEKGKEAGRIKILFDTDGDGMIDSTKIFADQLLEATSILPWKEGLLVTSAPYILYLKDTNNDYTADVKEILFSGFFDNNSEAQITNLRFGVDNWIYASNNGQSGEVTFHRDPDAKPVSTRGGDFRFRLDKNLFELEAGGAQFGQAMDDWGNRFITQNTLHIRHVVIPWRYTHRHPYLPSTNVSHNISDHDLEMFQDTPPPYWRAERTRRRQIEYKEQGLDREEYAEDHFTGCSGGTFFSGDGFPEGFYGSIFTGDVAGNLIHRDILQPLKDSPTFVAQRDAKETTREFLSSTDPWFRPTSFTVGPDGYLYVLDYYRQHIETPLSIPEDLKEDMDFYKGSDKGRIYRILPKSATPETQNHPDLKKATSKELVQFLANPNGTWRLMAQRLLLERQDTSTLDALKEMFSSHDDPRTRLHAFYALEGMNSLNETLVNQAMKDPHPGIRQHGAILAEQFPGCLPTLLTLLDDPDIRTALQATLSIGQFNSDEIVTAFSRVVEKYGQDAWFQMAVLSAKAGSCITLLEKLNERSSYFKEVTKEKTDFLKKFAHVITARNTGGETALLARIITGGTWAGPIWQAALLDGITSGIKSHENKGELTTVLKEAMEKIGEPSDETLKKSIKDLQDALAKE